MKQRKLNAKTPKQPQQEPNAQPKPRGRQARPQSGTPKPMKQRSIRPKATPKPRAKRPSRAKNAATNSVNKASGKTPTKAKQSLLNSRHKTTPKVVKQTQTKVEPSSSSAKSKPIGTPEKLNKFNAGDKTDEADKP